MCLCNSYLQTVTAAVDVNHAEQFMEALNKEQLSKNKIISWCTGPSAGIRCIKGLLWIYTIIAKNTVIARCS